LFTPGSGEQVHDYNGGIPASGLFWTVEIPPESFSVNNGERRAKLILRDLPLIDTFQFLGPNSTPAELSMTIEWEAVETQVSLGSGTAVPPTDPAAFLGNFAKANSTAQISGRELGFSFQSNPGVDSSLGYAELGRERNGVFL
jgi:hypothetical protein